MSTAFRATLIVVLSGVAVAIVAVFVLLIVGVSASPTSVGPGVYVVGEDVAQGNYQTTHTDNKSCYWRLSEAPPGRYLTSGRVPRDFGGGVGLDFYNGTTVTLEGPCQWSITSGPLTSMSE